MERGRGIALWRQIEQQLTADIAAGVYPEGSRLPTEPELASRFAVNRHTLRRAIRALGDQGLVRVEQGRGTFVQENVVDYMIGRRTRFSEIISSQNRTPGGQLLRAYEVDAPSTVAKALKVRQGTRCSCLETVSEVDSRPVNLATNYFPVKRFPGLIDVYAETGSITKTLAHFGSGDYERRTTKITARLPDSEEAKLLRQPVNRPLLISESVNVDRDGAPIQYGIARFASDRIQLIVETGA